MIDKKSSGPQPGRKKRRMCLLSTKEKIAIVHEVVVNQLSNIDVALKFNVKPILVSVLVCRSRKNREFLSELMSKDDIAINKRTVI
jgi:hypothetical protein